MILSLKEELSKGKSKSCREYDFDSTPNSKLYETGLERNKKRRDLTEDYINNW